MRAVRDFFWTLSGGDKIIIEKCDTKTQVQFGVLGISVFGILILCFIASWFSFKSLFHSHVIGACMACFFATLIFNLYLLLQTTISRNFLPVPDDGRVISKFGKALSLFIRLGFIAFLSVVVAKPIEEMVYSGHIDNDIARFKELEMQQSRKYVDFHYEEEKRILENSLFEYQMLRDEKSIQRINSELIDAQIKYEKAIHRIIQLSEESEYFVQRLKILCSDYPLSWTSTLFFSCFFFLPVGIKFVLSGRTSAYYQLKCEVDKNKIVEHYNTFKEKYATVFWVTYGKKIRFEEKHTEPPFNVHIHQDTREFSGQHELLALLYGKE